MLAHTSQIKSMYPDNAEPSEALIPMEFPGNHKMQAYLDPSN